MLKSESFQLRLTKPQMDRLTEVMRVTGLGKAEHIRRAVDYYLAGWRGTADISAEKPQPQPEPVRVPANSPLAQAEPAPVVQKRAQSDRSGAARGREQSVKVARR